MLLEHEHLYKALRYVERNPVRAGSVGKAWDWEWSSAAYHAGEKNKSRIELAKSADIVRLEGISWKEYLRDKEDPEEIEAIRKCAMSGRPPGGEEFIKALSKIAGIDFNYRAEGGLSKNSV
ncbi:MAG: hypothetical protein KJ687_09375 [Proteobacteria bacterium]|nr:hypothetical protein [Pseudomonadota bacterium]